MVNVKYFTNCLFLKTKEDLDFPNALVAQLVEQLICNQ